MGFYVMIIKEREDDREVIYRFGPDESNLGSLRLEKANGEVIEVSPLQTDNARHFIIRATVKLRQHWNKGEYPDRTSWES